MTFDEWLDIRNSRGVVNFAQTQEVLQSIWDAATSAERDRCKQKCEELADDRETPYKDYENTYINGWLDACNECGWAIHGCIPKSQVFTAADICEAANIGKTYFENNKPIDIQIMGADEKYS